MLQFICGFVLGFSIMEFLVLLPLLKKSQAPAELKSLPSVEPEVSKEFVEQDQENTKAFMETLSALNSFMTGTDFDEEIKNVGSQERTEA